VYKRKPKVILIGAKMADYICPKCDTPHNKQTICKKCGKETVSITEMLQDSMRSIKGKLGMLQDSIANLNMAIRGSEGD